VKRKRAYRLDVTADSNSDAGVKSLLRRCYNTTTYTSTSRFCTCVYVQFQGQTVYVVYLVYDAIGVVTGMVCERGR
jgi:hypothetical protein